MKFKLKMPHMGTMVVNVDDPTRPAGTCEERRYAAGQSFVDAGHGHVHSAYNPAPGPTVFIATFFEAPETGPLLIPADPGC